MSQEILAFMIVGLALVITLWWVARRTVTAPISKWLLTRGHVKWAMRFRRVTIAKTDCAGCEKSNK